jgi:hypothetical protein
MTAMFVTRTREGRRKKEKGKGKEDRKGTQERKEGRRDDGKRKS